MTSNTSIDQRYRVLIVEDEALLGQEIQGRLQHLGHDVVGIADNGPAAIELAEKERPDLILMDIRIKGPMDGIEVATRIYDDLELPVVYLTAHADQGTLQRAKATSQFGYIVKPFQERELMLAVDIAVRRHRVEKNLQHGRLTYATILAGISDAVVATDHESRVCFLNRVAETLTGWQIEEAIGVPVEKVMELVCPQTDAKLNNPMGEVLTGRIPASLDKLRRLRNRDGKLTAVEVSKSPVTDNDGKVIGSVAVLRDVTELRRAEQRFRNLLQSAPDAMIIVNASGSMLMVNSETARMFGYDSSELVGQVVEILLPERYREQHVAYRGRFCNSPKARRMGAGMDLRGRRKDGTEFPIEVSLSPLETEEGLMITAAIRDITERKRAEEALRQSQKMEAIGTLAGGIAHDFNNILAAMIGFLELARTDLHEPGSLTMDLDEIAKAANRAKVLVRQILTFSRQDRAQRVVLSLGGIVEECVGLLRATIPASVAIQTVIRPGVPDVFADGTQIHQVLLNLCTNAWHALPNQGGKITITLEPVEVMAEAAEILPGLTMGKYARLSIQDNGHGMDVATRAKVFEPFFTTKPTGKGTGLGLSVVLGIVQSHNGVIDMSSELGRGTTVHIYLPAAGSRAPVESAQQKLQPRGDSQRILFVDDEQALTRMAKRGLERFGYRAEVFNHASQALETFAARADEFDAMVTDLSMPGMSGLDLAQEILKIRPGMGIVLCSGNISEELSARAREIGVARILLKPVSLEELTGTLKSICEKRD